MTASQLDTATCVAMCSYTWSYIRFWLDHRHCWIILEGAMQPLPCRVNALLGPHGV
jgi:hypothetical protein